MSYNTNFRGVLTFTAELTIPQLRELQRVVNDLDRRPVIDLEVTEDYTGLEWTGAEKTYDMAGSINHVIAEMRKTWPDFGLSGEMEALCRDYCERSRIVMRDGKASEVKA